MTTVLSGAQVSPSGYPGPQGTVQLPRNYLAGCIVSNNVSDTANDIDIAPGECRDDSNSADIVIPTVLTKRLDAAWAAGTNQGGRDTGVISDATWHVFAIRNPSTNAADVLFSQSITAPTMPGGFTQKRRIASIIRRGAGGILPFKQYGDYFQYPTPYLDINGATQAQGAFGPLGMLSIPTGKKFLGDFVVRVHNNTGAGSVEVRDPDQAGSGIGTVCLPAANVSGGYPAQIWTASNNNLFVWAASVPASSTTNYYISVLGYWDYRGKED
jgi:hypothetical protein